MAAAPRRRNSDFYPASELENPIHSVINCWLRAISLALLVA